MAAQLFRLDFDRVHFGNDGLARSTVGCTAGTLFSALCHQALRAGGESQLSILVATVIDGALRLSDLHPYVRDTYLVPKPLIRVRSAQTGQSGLAAASAAKKAAKRLDYLPAECLAEFMSGRADLSALALVQAAVGTRAIASRASVFNGQIDAEPYNVGLFAFAPDAGLWLLAHGNSGELELLSDLLRGLTALGGERTSGYGTFRLSSGEVSRTPLAAVLSAKMASATRGTSLMSLTAALPADSELPDALDGATYRLARRGGWVASSTYSDTPLRKRDIFKFAAGSVFAHSFDGVVADVANGGRHPVLSYAKPLFLPLPDITEAIPGTPSTEVRS